MTHIVCLIADPATHPLDPPLARSLARELGGRLRWLDEAAAVEIAVDSGDAAGVSARVDAILGDQPVDRAVLPAEGRRKQLLVTDMDSTIITIECIDELADFAGIKDEVAAITARAMRGELDFAEALEARVGLLKGLRASIIDEVCRERLRLMPGARELVLTMRAHGATTALVSGGFTAFTGHVRDLVGFDHDSANRLEVEAGVLTGRLVPPLVDGSDKRRTLETLRDRLGLAREATLGLGDGANDRLMVEAAGLGVAFRPKPVLAEAADATIRHGDLTAVLYLQGYARSAFVTA